MVKRYYLWIITVLSLVLGAASGEELDGWKSPAVVSDPNAFRFIVVYTSNDNEYDDEECICADIRSLDSPSGTSYSHRLDTSHGVPHDDPDIAMNTDSVVVVWTSSDSDGQGIVGRVFDPNLTALTGEFAINSNAAGNQYAPATAIDNQGRWMAVWTSGTEPDREVHGRIFDTTGLPLCEELTISSGTDDFSPAIAASPDGVFTVAFACEEMILYGVCLQQYNADGTAHGSQKVLANGLANQPNVSVDVNKDGTIAAAWDGDPSSESQTDIFITLYDSNGNTLGIPSSSIVNTFDTGRQAKPSIALSDSGRCVIAWESENVDGNDYGICGRTYDPNGVAEGDEFGINTYIYRKQHQPDVAMNSNGLFLTAWQCEIEQCYDHEDLFCIYYPTIDCQIGAKVEPSHFLSCGDATGNGFVDLNDLITLSQRWLDWDYLASSPRPDFYPDGHFDLNDFMSTSHNWMQCCECFYPPEYQWAWDQNRLTACASKLKGLMIAIIIYSYDYNDDFPPDLETLVAGDYIDTYWPDEAFQCPAVCPHVQESDYVYRGDDLDDSVSAMMVVMYDRAGNHADGLRNVGFADGHVESMTNAEFLAAIAADNAYRRSSPRLEEKPIE